LASSLILSKGRKLFELNSKDWMMPMSKFQKLEAGVYIILKDYSVGKFPPTFEDQAAAYQGEINFYESLPGMSLEEAKLRGLRKPFWNPFDFERYSRHFVKLLRVFKQLGVKPGSRLLELGCGTGWMAEFLVYAGYSVVGTSLAPNTIELANRRVAALKAKGFDGLASFKVGPMETVHEYVDHDFDGIFVFESLHHAFDWRKSIRSSYQCLKPGGWLLLANEPNLLHTFISYRKARLSKTHEIGMSRKQIVEEMTRCGFAEVRALEPGFNNYLADHWIAARR
jgi:SAM-dependent methyltransferase